MRRAALLVGVSLLMWACTEGASTTTVAPSTTQTTPAPTTTSAPTTTQTTGALVWDLVALGDSVLAGWGVPSPSSFDPEQAFAGIYARLLGAELGVEVVLHAYYPSQTSNEVRTVAEWNQTVADDTAIRADLAGAEVVIIWLGTHNLVPWFLFGSCGTTWPDPLEGCIRAATETMPADFAELLGTIRELVPEGTTVLIADQAVIPLVVDRWGEKPFWSDLKKVAYDGWAEGIETAASAHEAIVVHSSEVLSGPNGNQLLHPEFVLPDRLHINAAGQQFLAELFLAADGLGA